MENGFQYYAFISYKREDEKWARWLQDKLRWYKLPSKLCKQITRLPKRVWPVFRDNTDLDGGTLEQNIRGELERSQYLIVICSPEAARSQWVGKEVGYFVSLGRAERIIPFVISGEPYSNNPETECIHGKIKVVSDKELLAINVNEKGVGSRSRSMKKRRAFIRVVAKLLDIKFNALWQPYERALKIRRWVFGITAAIVLLGLGFVCDYNRTKCEYYADYVDGIYLKKSDTHWIKGIFPLKKSRIQKGEHYRFEYKRIPLGEEKSYQWQLKQVTCLNKAGYPVKPEQIYPLKRYAIQKFYYRKDNEGIDKIEYCDVRANPIVIANIKGADFDLIEFLSENKNHLQMDNVRNNLEESFDINFSWFDRKLVAYLSMNNVSTIKYHKLSRNMDEYVEAIKFQRNDDLDPVNNFASDKDSIYSIKYVLDSIGRVSHCWFNDEENYGKRGIDTKNFISYSYKPDDYRLYKFIVTNQMVNSRAEFLFKKEWDYDKGKITNHNFSKRPYIVEEYLFG